jgi:hypothetical protein
MMHSASTQPVAARRADLVDASDFTVVTFQAPVRESRVRASRETAIPGRLSDGRRWNFRQSFRNRKDFAKARGLANA